MTSAALAARTWIALVHHPVYDKTRRVVTTAVTNLDIHDIARAARTFGLAGYFVITPIDAQRDLVGRILGHWSDGAGREHNDKRSEALAGVRVVGSLDDAISALGSPYVVATAARASRPPVSFQELVTARETDERPMLVLMGTGWGMTDEVLAAADAVLPPIRAAGGGEYNHLSVRSAAAIVLDRLFGNRA